MFYLEFLLEGIKENANLEDNFVLGLEKEEGVPFLLFCLLFPFLA
jgi:hypothetical protein